MDVNPLGFPSGPVRDALRAPAGWANFSPRRVGSASFIAVLDRSFNLEDKVERVVFALRRRRFVSKRADIRQAAR